MNDKTDDRLDKILDRSFEYRGEEWQKDKADLKALMQAERIEAKQEVLEYLLTYASGGGSWKLIIKEMLAELDTPRKENK
jgi:hypothetical protein